MVKLLKRNISVTTLSALLSLYTLIAYHKPLFEVVISNLEGGFNGFVITASFVVLILATNFLFANLILYTMRVVGKVIIAISLICDALMLYFVNTYDVLVTDAMMGNVFNTRYSEASGFFSWVTVLYIVLLGVVPALLLLMTKVDYKSLKRFGINSGIALATMITAVAINFNNFTWIDRNATQIGSLLMPWSYTVNSVRYYNAEKKRNAKEILLPDAEIKTTDRQAVVLIIGESARRSNIP